MKETRTADIGQINVRLEFEGTTFKEAFLSVTKPGNASQEDIKELVQYLSKNVLNGSFVSSSPIVIPKPGEVDELANRRVGAGSSMPSGVTVFTPNAPMPKEVIKFTVPEKKS